jgi:hypothetical protein
MGNNCPRRGPITPRSHKSRALDTKSLVKRFKIIFPNRDPVIELFEGTPYEFWRDWIEVLTPREHFRLAVKRVIWHLNTRKKWAYKGHILKQLKEQVIEGKPSPTALFKTPLGDDLLVRRNGELSRKLFHSWIEDDRRWVEVPAPGNPGGAELRRPWTGDSKPRPSGRKLTNNQSDPPQSTVPRTSAFGDEARASTKARARPKGRGD